MWRVSAYNPAEGFGFCAKEDDPTEEVFFHAEAFRRVRPGGPLPILGETVTLGRIKEGGGRRPAALEVTRSVEPPLLQGEVTRFDPARGWGFLDYCADPVFFHRAECRRSWVPLAGQPVEFYMGTTRGKPRALWVRPLE